MYTVTVYIAARAAAKAAAGAPTAARAASARIVPSATTGPTEFAPAFLTRDDD